MILDKSLREFAQSLAAREPVPGGGAAASYVGSLGAALAGMAIAYSIKKDEPDRTRIAELAEGLDFMNVLREELLELTDKDCHAYGAFAEAKKLAKNTKEEKATRKEVMNEALENAMDIPFKGAARCIEGLNRLSELANLISPQLISDVGVAALCLRAAYRSCWYNVWINANALKDKKRHFELIQEQEKMEAELSQMEARIFDDVEGFLKG